MRRVTAVALIVVPVLGCAAPVRAAAPPVRADIVVDGSFDDWSVVLTNPTNASHDAQGALVPCAVSGDRDCPINWLDHDLAEFAWTWSDTKYYFMARWHGTAPTERVLYVYFDDDMNGYLENNDQVLKVSVNGNDGTFTMEIHSYRKVSAGIGDPITDVDGWADGHTMPGTMVFDQTAGSELAITANGSLVEGAVSTDGFPYFPAVNFHVSAARTGPVPVRITDNMGGAGGRTGTTAWRGVSVSPGRTVGAAPGQVVRLWHLVENTGNVEDRVNLAATSRSGHDLTFLLDADDDGNPETWLGTDSRGDGLMSLAGDVLTAAGDSDGDTVMDLGYLRRWWPRRRIAIEQTIPASAAGFDEEVEVRAWQDSAPNVRGTATDIIRLGEVTIAPSHEVLAAAGDGAVLGHVIQNNTTSPATVDVGLVAARGWPVTVLGDPDGDGDPADATALSDTDGSGLPDVAVPAGGSAAVLVRVDVPAGEAAGTRETDFVRAIRAGTRVSVSIDGTTVAPPVDVSPDHLLADGDARYGAAGGSVWFPHRLVNATSRTRAFDLQAASDRGWPASLFLDPDGDGRPHDAAPLPAPAPAVAANGGVLPLLVRLDVPAASAVGEVSRVTLSAAAADDASVGDTAGADAVVAIVRVYEDATHTVNVARTRPCTTVHAGANGLRPSATGYRFTWRDGAGAVLRVQDVGTDSAGRCADLLALDQTQAGTGFRVDVEEWDGVRHVRLDSAVFDVVDEVVLEALSLDPIRVDLSDASLAAEATLANLSPDTPVADVPVDWVVLDEARTAYLDATGTFAPYTGVEITRSDLVTLPAGGRQTVRLTLHGIGFAQPGMHRVEAWRSAGCVSRFLDGAATFDVLDDADRDGLERDVELAAGTNPDDADTDDDGLPDGSEALVDTDGDGDIDALDCDSDGDGLADGTETGITDPGPGTDPSFGCFVPDVWPLTTTDPRVADTDGGGLPDGLEDLSADGRLDAGEKDPNDPSDDAADCSTATPPAVEDLRLRHDGPRVWLTWQVQADSCTSYVVLAADAPPDWSGAGAVVRPPWSEQPAAPLRYYLVGAESPFGGAGPTGR